MQRKEDGGGMSHDERLAILETTIVHVDRDLTEIKKTLKDNREEAKIDNASLRAEIISNRAEMRQLFFWIVGCILGLVGVMAHGFHWL